MQIYFSVFKYSFPSLQSLVGQKGLSVHLSDFKTVGRLKLTICQQNFHLALPYDVDECRQSIQSIYHRHFQFHETVHSLFTQAVLTVKETANAAGNLSCP